MEPIVFPQCYRDAWLNKAWDDLYNITMKWNPARGLNQWWIDALTMETPKKLGSETGLGVQGEAPPVLETQLANSRPGSTPAVLAYIAVHAQHGCRIWFPHHGAKGAGGAKNNEPGKPWEGFVSWVDTLSKESKDLLVDLNYFNQPDAMKKIDDRRRAQMMDKDAFTPDNFLVWSFTHVPLSE